MTTMGMTVTSLQNPRGGGASPLRAGPKKTKKKEKEKEDKKNKKAHSMKGSLII